MENKNIYKDTSRMSMIDQVNFTSNSFENMLNGMLSGNISANDISNKNI